jgi:hypothetical protein
VAGRARRYLISTDETDMSKKGDSYAGKVKSNFVGTEVWRRLTAPALAGISHLLFFVTASSESASYLCALSDGGQ